LYLGKRDFGKSKGKKKGGGKKKPQVFWGSFFFFPHQNLEGNFKILGGLKVFFPLGEQKLNFFKKKKKKKIFFSKFLVFKPNF